MIASGSACWTTPRNCWCVRDRRPPERWQLLAERLGRAGSVAAAASGRQGRQQCPQGVAGVAEDRHVGRKAADELLGVDVDPDQRCRRSAAARGSGIHLGLAELGADREHDVGRAQRLAQRRPGHVLAGVQRMAGRQDALGVDGVDHRQRPAARPAPGPRPPPPPHRRRSPSAALGAPQAAPPPARSPPARAPGGRAGAAAPAADRRRVP